MKKGNPAAALAIIVSIFGAAGVVCLWPDARREQPLQAHLLPSTPALVMTTIAAPPVARPAIVDRFTLSARALPAVVPTARMPEIHAADSVVVLEFSGDAGTPPALSATPLSIVAAAAAPIAAEPAPRDDRQMGAVPAAFDRTGSALAFAIKKTGAGVRTAVSMLTP